MDCGSFLGQGTVSLLLLPRCCGGTCLETEAVVSSFKDVAAVGETIEQGRCHLGITEDRGPFAEAEVGCDHDAGAFVKFAQEVEEERPT